MGAHFTKSRSNRQSFIFCPGDQSSLARPNQICLWLRRACSWRWFL